MSSIWDTKKKNKQEKTNLKKELSDEILEFREKNKVFQATNESDTYCVLVFSCAKDRNEFLQNTIKKKDTYIDGYKIAEIMGVSPQKPSLKLPKPLSK